PIRFVNLDAIVLGGLLDVGEGEVAIGIGNILNLIKACECVYDMVRVGQWLLSLTWKSEHTLGQLRPIVNLAVFGAGHPSGLHGTSSLRLLRKSIPALF